MHRLVTSYGLIGFSRLIFSWLVTKVFYRPARLIRLPVYIRGRSAMTWGEGFTTGVGVRLDAFRVEGTRPVLLIGRRVQLNDYVHIGAVSHVVIGDDVMIASRVFISDHNHGAYDGREQSNPDEPPAQRLLTHAPVIIEDRVWIGENVCILPGVRIGVGSIVGAGAVVTHNLPAGTISVGVPAKVIKRFDRKLKEWVNV
jgi:lipopolysaccharide O-acetyltransferase